MIDLDMRGLQEQILNSRPEQEFSKMNCLNAPAKFSHSFFEPLNQRTVISNSTYLKSETTLSNNTVPFSE